MKRLVFLLVTLSAFAVPSFAQDDTVVEEIVARINNSIVTRADLRRAREAMQQETQQAQQQNPGQPAPDLAERQKDLLRDLIDQQLLIQKGQDIGVNVDADMVKKLDELRQQMNAKSMDDLENAAKEQGVSFEDFKQNMKNNMITQQVIGKEVSSKIQVTKAEVQAYYDAHKAELERPEQIRLSEILVAIESPKNPDAKDGDKGKKDAMAEPDTAAVEAAEAKAKALLDEINKGEHFEDVAKKSSNGPTAAQGGELGMFKRGVLAKELELKTFAMAAGEVSEPIRTKQGFVILKVTGHTQPGVPELSAVENQIQETLYYQKLQPSLRQYLTKLREDAYIDIKQGYVDSGASPNQTKPVMASANAPANGPDAKKKHKKRFLVF